MSAQWAQNVRKFFNMEVAYGKIITTNAREGYVEIRVPFDGAAFERAGLRQYDVVEVGFPDGRTRTPEQLRKAYALLGEIAEWSGDDKESVKAATKHDFLREHLIGLRKELFSLSNCDVTTAREYITYLVEFCIRHHVQIHVPLVELCDDIQRYVYACMMHKACAVCGKPAQLHHVDHVGMGRNRNDICHIGMRALPLCSKHHLFGEGKEGAAHNMGLDEFLAKYHLEPVEIDEQIAKVYRLRSRRAQHE